MNILKNAVLATPITILIAGLSGCAGAPDGVYPVTGFELPKYLGTWYEIARLDNRFQRDLSHVTAEYSVRPDGGVHVVNRGFNTVDGKWEEAIGKAYFVGDSNVGQLKVSFFGPFYGSYNIIALDKSAYQYSLVAGSSRKYLWLLSRTPQMDAATADRLAGMAADLGFPAEDLIFVNHR